MSTKNIIPRNSGEGQIGLVDRPWSKANFNQGNFVDSLVVSGQNIVEKINEISGSLGSLEESPDIAALSGSINSLSADLDSLSADLDTISGLQSPDMSGVSGSIQALTENLNAVSGSLADLEETPDVNALSGSLDSLTADVATISASLADLEETPDVNALSGSLDSLTADVATISASLADLEETPDVNALSGSLVQTGANLDADIQEISGAMAGVGTPKPNSVNSAAIINGAVTSEKLEDSITIAQDLSVAGDLFVSGSTVTVEASTIIVEDKNIEIGSTDNPTDITADGGGITLKGDTDKTILWSGAKDAWAFNTDVIGTGIGDRLTHEGLPYLVSGDASSQPALQNWTETNGHIIPNSNAAFDLGNAEYKVRHLFLSDNSLYIGGTNITVGDTLGELIVPSGLAVTKDSTFNGKVGIGTSSPSAIVEVVTTDGSTIYDPSDTKPPEIADYLLSLRNTYDGGNVAGTFAGIQFNVDGDGVGNTNSVGSINLVIEEDNLQKASLCFSPDPGDITRKEAMRISSDGYIGVGTTDPVAPMHIKRDSQGGEANALVLQNNFANDSGESVNLSFRGTADHDLASIDALVTATDAGGKYPADLIFKTSTAGQDKVEKLRIDSDGKVGIGTSSPQGNLEVSSDASQGTNFYLNNTNDPATQSNWRMQSDSNGDFNIGPMTTSFYKHLSIIAGGNVGIGTTTPERKLHINSGADNTPLKLTSSDTAVRMEFQDSTGTSWIEGRQDFRFGNVLSGSDNELVRISSDGNVGIGDSNPSKKLSVAGDAIITGDLTINGTTVSVNTTNLEVADKTITVADVTTPTNDTANGAGIIVKAPTNKAILYNKVNDSFDFNIGSTFGGNVGIGTTSPAYTLDVSGDINFTGNLTQNGAAFASSVWTQSSSNISYTAGKVSIGTAATSRKLNVKSDDANIAAFEGSNLEGVVFVNNTNGRIDILGYSDSQTSYNPIVVRAGSASSLWIGTDGNVGIGASSAAYTLDVAGDINFTGNLTQNGAAFGAYTDSNAISAVTGSSLDMGSNDITTTGKIKFANMYANLGDLPDATTYHGMFAHVHSTGKAYYAHGGNWVELANADDISSFVTQTDIDNSVASFVTQTDIDNSVAGLVDSAPAALDTLNELAEALGDDANFSTTVTNSIGEKLSKSGGTMAGDLDMGGGQLHNFSASVNAQTGTSYTLASSDRGKVLTFENASDITVTVAPSLGAGFSCTCIQLGEGQVIFAAGSGVTVSNRQSHTKIAGNKGMATLASYAADTFILCGDTAE